MTELFEELKERSKTMDIDWSDPGQAIPWMVHILDAMKEDVSLSATGRELEICSLVGSIDNFLAGVEQRMETTENYFLSISGFYDFENMLEYWKELLEYGASYPIELPDSPY